MKIIAAYIRLKRKPIINYRGKLMPVTLPFIARSKLTTKYSGKLMELGHAHSAFLLQFFTMLKMFKKCNFQVAESIPLLEVSSLTRLEMKV